MKATLAWASFCEIARQVPLPEAVRDDAGPSKAAIAESSRAQAALRRILEQLLGVMASGKPESTEAPSQTSR